MSELNVPGIASQLILDLSKWMEPLRRALSDSRTLGKELDGNLAGASNSAGKALGNTGTEADELAKAVGAAAKEVDGLARANASIKPPPMPPPTNVINYGAGLRSLAGIAGTVSPAMGQMVSGFTAIEGAAAAAGVGLTAAIAPIGLVVGALAGAKAAFSFGLEGVKLAADMEQTSLSFEVMIGSADRAKATLDALKQFAATTPFEFPEIANAGKQLLAMGIDAKDLTSKLRMLGDVGSGLGQPLGEMAYLFGQIKSQGRAMTQDLNQFAGRGVPIYTELARVLGTTELGVRQLAEQGKIGFAEINAAFEAMTGEGGKFFEMTKRQSGTLNGLLSTLSDGWNEIKRQVGESIIANLDLKGAVETVTEAVGVLAPVMVKCFADATQWIKSAFHETAAGQQILQSISGSIDLIAGKTSLLESDLPNNLKVTLGLLNGLKLACDGIAHAFQLAVGWAFELAEAAAFVWSGQAAKKMAEYNKALPGMGNQPAGGNAPAGSSPSVPAALPARPASPSSTGAATSTAPATHGGPAAPADKAEAEQAASRARAKEMEWQNFIQGLKLRGLNELADLQDRRHKADADIAKAKSQDEKNQLAIARDMDLEEIRGRYRRQRGEEGGPPSIASTVSRRTQALTPGGSSRAPAGASGGGVGSVTVNAPPVDLERLGAILARNVIPAIDARIDALDRRTRLETLSSTVRRGG